MTAPIGPLTSGALPRGTDGVRSIVVPVLPGAGQPGAVDPKEGPSFADTFSRAMNEISDTRDRSSDLTKRFAAGEPVELHTVMAASAEAGLALDLAIEMRNKVVEAYRSLINMQS